MIGQEPLLKLAPVRFCHGLFLFNVREKKELLILHKIFTFMFWN
uniref:Uncharacterized protein n=1 Tax=Siphoviridae sp. ctXQ014 TaxID=2825542 RepID=A0A8S5PN52_9CAUD|nr:MAG TPA: hypothetical protein [Siphoviridae sp. ctXQ014]DAI89868.1 MAG TPA: hypothetical protein [Caudoviricetes sp.]DAL61820.1 MAG TPA_asm: hypothetical protein [Caudoviricetes sp.]